MEIVSQKLEILYQQKIINKKYYAFLKILINDLEPQVKENKKEDFNRMMTHLMMFLNRVQNNKQLTELDPTIIKNITTHKSYKKAMSFLKINFLAKLKIEPTEAELNFLLMHILNIFYSK